jgi:tetratricopeptide (TPR) repeat protein
VYRLQTRKRFKFLFVGGTLHRKGFDLLLKAYRQVFSAGDDVCLVVKDMGVGTFYRGQNATALIAEHRKSPGAAEIEYLADDLSEEQMAGLYGACDCVAQPYRGEGFCLPVAEAMACARPVIVTGYGPSLDYCTDETAYLLSHQIARMAEKRVGDLETIDFPHLAAPAPDALRRLLRHVFEHPEEARGVKARAYVRARLTWAHAAAVAVLHFPWIDSFSAARNVSLKHATGEWLFWMDADDRLDDVNREKLRRLLAELPEENVGYAINCRCLPQHDTGAETVVKHIRLFRNHPELKWEYGIHEQMLPALKRLKTTIRFTDVVVNHTGYQDPALRGRKLERDLRLLLLEYSEQPNDPFTLFNLANTYRQKGETEKALDLYRKSLAGSAPVDSIVSQLYAVIAQCERQLNRPAEALATCRLGRIHYPDDAEILNTESQALHDLDDLSGAIACMEFLIRGSEAERFTSRDTGVRGFRARHTLGGYYKKAGRVDDAVAQWQLALAEQPGFMPPIFALGDTAVARRDWIALEDVIVRLRALPKVAAEAEVYRARAHQARGEFTAALAVLDVLLLANPLLFSACFVRSAVLIEEGRDWAAAEEAVRAVLVIVPNHAEARKNLDLVLLRRQAG